MGCLILVMPSRYGTGERYGFDFCRLPAERVRQLALVSHKEVECPFKPHEPGKPRRRCNKKGGVCSLRLFVQDTQGQVEGKGDPVITCPNRFLEAGLVKVPTISRWGKKMAVVIDKAFWESLSEMRETKDLSNCEIVWFVVAFEASKDGRFTLRRDEVHYTTLSNAVEGLTGGTPMSLERFEREIRLRLSPS